jgi:hypothetical protein
METSETIQHLVEKEITDIADASLVARIRELLVVPYAVDREWDYGSPRQTYRCWNVLEHRPSNLAIVFCSLGFGPTYSWGLVFLWGPTTNMGMDSQWYANLEDAVRNSPAWEGPNPEGYEAQ